MKIVIIEDESLTAEDLQRSILSISPESRIEAVLSSLQEAVDYFSHNPMPELLFCDIQLGDGSIFDLLKRVKIDVPVIFCTAYDEHTLQAFKLNGIEYILLKPQNPQTLLVYYRDNIIPVNCSDIGLVYISNQITYLQTLGNKKYILNKTLDELEQILDHGFFRVNRTAIVNKKLIQEVNKQLNRKLVVNLDPCFKTDIKITVSKSKSPLFLKWLKNA